MQVDEISNKNISSIWRDLIKVCSGETLSNDTKFLENLNGMTISPKRSFCILKLWMKNLDFKDPGKICEIDGLTSHGCLFKRHNSSK